MSLTRALHYCTDWLDTPQPYDLIVGPFIAVGLIALLSLHQSRQPALRFDQLVPVQVGVVDGDLLASANTQLDKSSSPTGIKEQALHAKSNKPLAQKEKSGKNTQAHAQQGSPLGTVGMTEGVPREIPIKPEVADLPYGPDQVPLLVLVDSEGDVLEVDLEGSTGNLGRDLLTKSLTQSMNFKSFPEFKKLNMKPGQKVWLTYGITKNLDAGKLYLP